LDHRVSINVIQDAITIDIRIADVAKAVKVEVILITIRDYRTVIHRIQYAITIGVGGNFGSRALNTDSEAVPPFIGHASPADGIECAQEADGAMRLTGTQQTVFDYAITQINHFFVRRAASPVTTAVTVFRMAIAENLEILVKGVAIAIQAHIGKHQVGHGFVKLQRLGPGIAQADNIGVGRNIGDTLTGER